MMNEAKVKVVQEEEAKVTKRPKSRHTKEIHIMATKPQEATQKKTSTAVHANRNHLYARSYAKEGFMVLPCWPDSKKPLTPNGFSDATKDLKIIDYWWARCPQANVAIQTRDLLVLDVDCKNGIDGFKTIKALEKRFGKLPETKTQSTPSGGRHYIYKTRNIIVPSSINCPGDGLDIRAYSGYILAEPSTIDGKLYVMDKTEISEAPIWLVNLIYKNSAIQTEDIYHPKTDAPFSSLLFDY